MKSGFLRVLVIDEFHLVLAEGQDWRPSYRVLGELRLRLKKCSVATLTGTATIADSEEVQRLLHMCSPGQLSSRRKLLW